MKKETIIVLAAAMLPALLAPFAQAKEGYYHGNIEAVSTRKSGLVAVRVTPPPPDQDFTCRNGTLQFMVANLQDEVRFHNLGEALSTNAMVSLHLTDETNSSGNNYCDVGTIERMVPTALIVSPSPPPPSPPPPPPPPVDDHADNATGATNLALGGQRAGRIDPAGDLDYFRVRVSGAGTLTVYATGSMDNRGVLYDSAQSQLASNDDGGQGLNFRIEHSVSAGTYYVLVRGYSSTTTGSYTVHADFQQTSENYFGAFARSSETAPGAWQYFAAYNYRTRAAAENEALRQCRSRISSGDSCSIEQRFGSGECFVLVSGNDGYFIAYGADRRENLDALKQNRLAACRADASNCRLEIEVCNSGTYSGIAPQAARETGATKRKHQPRR